MLEQDERQDSNAQGQWLLRAAIAFGTAGLFATFVDQLATGIVLYLTAFAMISLFYRKTVRPFWRKYIRPLQDLTEKLDEIREQQGAIKGQIGAVKEKAEEIDHKADMIRLGAELAAERADVAINVAEAVRRQLKVSARGDGDDEPR